MSSVSLTPPASPSAPRSVQNLRQREQRQTLLLLVCSLPLVLFLLVPLAALLLRLSPAALLTHLVQPQVAQAIGLSMATTILTLGITLVVGTPVGYLLARGHFRGRQVLDTLIDLPMVLPPAVAGIALLLAFGRRGIWGQYLSLSLIHIYAADD